MTLLLFVYGDMFFYKMKLGIYSIQVLNPDNKFVGVFFYPLVQYLSNVAYLTVNILLTWRKT